MLTARSETVQPSLWDRLVDDLPELLTEMASLKRNIEEALGADADLERILQDGFAGLRRRGDLDDDVRKLCESFILRSAEAARIETSGVIVSADDLRKAVRRDIEMLFNVERLAADYTLTELEEQSIVTMQQLLQDFPEVAKSVVNYGVPAFAGKKGSDFDKDALAKDIKGVLQVFEPRLKPDTIKVEISYNERVGMQVNIDATLILSPVPERLRLATIINLESGLARTSLEDV